MTSFLVALSLLAAAAPNTTRYRLLPAAAAPEPARSDTLPPPPPASLPAVPASGGQAVPLPEEFLLAPSSAAGLGSALPALAVVASLAAIALYLSRRRPGTGRRLVQVLETASLGPRRQLVVVRLGDDLMLLGSSEAGVTLLSMQPAGAATAAATTGVQVVHLEPVEPERPNFLVGLWSRLRDRAPATPAAPQPSFEDLLQESADDQALRRKLASGRPARVA